jgi:hypothetical protein
MGHPAKGFYVGGLSYDSSGFENAFSLIECRLTKRIPKVGPPNEFDGHGTEEKSKPRPFKTERVGRPEKLDRRSALS